MRPLPILAVAALLSLTACGSELERTFGLTRDAPDEFTVTTRAPLSMPPDYTLGPPRPGASRPQELSAPQAAEAALAPDTAITPTQAQDSPGQQALLAQSGPTAPADIRDRVASESDLDAHHRSITDRLLFWRSTPEPGAPLDPAAESQRLRENAALGQSPTAGNTPIIQDKSKTKSSGWFDIF